MRLLILSLLASSIAKADSLSDFKTYISDYGYHHYTRDQMYNITAEAVTKREDVNLLLKNLEVSFWRTANKVGVDQKIVIPVATIAAPLYYKKVSTRGFHIYYSPRKNLTLRPDLDYYYTTKTYQVNLTANWRF